MKVTVNQKSLIHVYPACPTCPADKRTGVVKRIGIAKCNGVAMYAGIFESI